MPSIESIDTQHFYAYIYKYKIKKTGTEKLSIERKDRNTSKFVHSSAVASSQD